MIRATTGGVLKSYRNNLMNSFIKMNNTVNTVLSQRLFNSYAEDPASAAEAFQVRRSYLRTEAQKQVNSATSAKFTQAGATLKHVVDLVNNATSDDAGTAWGDVLRAGNDPTGDARSALAKALHQLADDVVASMNDKYGDTFVFAGADGLNVPFEMRGDKLYYRGVPVDAAVPKIATNGTGENAEAIKVTVGQDGTVTMDPASTEYLTGAQLTKENELATNPPVLTNPDGSRVEVDANGQMVAAGTAGSSYINTDETDTIAVDAYDAAAAGDQPTVLTDENGDPVRVNSRGRIDPTGDRYLVLDNQGTIQKADTLVAPADVEPKAQLLKDENGDPVLFDADGKIVEDPDTYTGEKYYLVTDGTEVITQTEYDQAVSDAEKLKFLSTEKYFVDIGLGYEEDEQGSLIESSGFNAALHGINYIGFGQDEDGDPKNIVSLINKIADLCEDGSWDRAEFDRLAGKLEDAGAHLITMHTDEWATAGKLDNNYERLDESMYTMQEQLSELEDVNMAEAISDFLWAQYCYNSALKVGNSILSESLMDYLK